jgi:hypothetical protein
MSQMLEIPDALYTALQEAAAASGLSPLAWIAAHLPTPQVPSDEGLDQEYGPKTLADLFAGRVGRIRSSGKERLSEEHGAAFTDYLEEQTREKEMCHDVFLIGFEG